MFGIDVAYPLARVNAFGGQENVCAVLAAFVWQFDEPVVVRLVVPQFVGAVHHLHFKLFACGRGERLRACVGFLETIFPFCLEIQCVDECHDCFFADHARINDFLDQVVGVLCGEAVDFVLYLVVGERRHVLCLGVEVLLDSIDKIRLDRERLFDPNTVGEAEPGFGIECGQSVDELAVVGVDVAERRVVVEANNLLNLPERLAVCAVHKHAEQHRGGERRENNVLLLFVGSSLRQKIETEVVAILHELLLGRRELQAFGLCNAVAGAGNKHEQSEQNSA